MPLSERQWLASLKTQRTAGEALELQRLEERLTRAVDSDAHPRVITRLNRRINELVGLDEVK